MILFLKYWHWFAIAALIVFGWAEWTAHNAAKVREGVAIERARVADSTLAIVLPRLARVDTIVVHDTLRLRAALARVDTLRDSIPVWKHDTTYIKEYVARTDTALKVCQDLANSCALFRTAATETIAALKAKVAAVPIVMPRSCLSTGAVWTVIGVGVGFLGGKIVK